MICTSTDERRIEIASTPVCVFGHWAALGCTGQRTGCTGRSFSQGPTCLCLFYLLEKAGLLPQTVAQEHCVLLLSKEHELGEFTGALGRNQKKGATRKKLGPTCTSVSAFTLIPQFKTVDIYEHCNWLVSAIVHDVVPIVDA